MHNGVITAPTSQVVTRLGEEICVDPCGWSLVDGEHSVNAIVMAGVLDVVHV